MTLLFLTFAPVTTMVLPVQSVDGTGSLTKIWEWKKDGIQRKMSGADMVDVDVLRFSRASVLCLLLF